MLSLMPLKKWLLKGIEVKAHFSVIQQFMIFFYAPNPTLDSQMLSKIKKNHNFAPLIKIIYKNGSTSDKHSKQRVFSK